MSGNFIQVKCRVVVTVQVFERKHIFLVLDLGSDGASPRRLQGMGYRLLGYSYLGYWHAC